MPVLEVSREQRQAIEFLLKSPKPVVTLGGYAGTGKTTVIKHLTRRSIRTAVCAFTGKAANVLRNKDVPATTIHSLIYKAQKMERVDAKGKKWTDVVFVRRDPWEIQRDYDRIVVDEASMVNRQIYNDLIACGLPVIFVGDHGQLEPVGGEGFNLMASPNITLEKVHRNAGEILHFANFIRQGNRPADWYRHELATDDSAVQLISFAELAGLSIPDPDQIICAFNRTRISMNKFVRDNLSLPSDRPVVGDRVMCLQNEHNIGVFNGMQGTISAIWADEMVFTSNEQDFRVRYIDEQFNNPKQERYTRSRHLPFDYAYCITCHKAQGDEWGHVMVLEQFCPGWEHSRWCYTAASRAKSQLTWIL